MGRHACDRMVVYCILSIFNVDTRHLDTKALTFLYLKVYYVVALSLTRKEKYCLLPSSDIQHTITSIRSANIPLVPLANKTIDTQRRDVFIQNYLSRVLDTVW